MKDEKKVKRAKVLVIFLFCLLIAIIGVSVTNIHSTAVKQKAIASSKAIKESKEKKSHPSEAKIQNQELTTDLVNKFVTAYYTKKVLEDNWKAYQPYVTPDFYKTLTSLDESKETQTTKATMIDFKLISSDVYIDAETHKAIAKVQYTNDNVNPKTGEKTTVTNSGTILLTYINDGTGYYVSDLATIPGFDDSGTNSLANLPISSSSSSSSTTTSGGGK